MDILTGRKKTAPFSEMVTLLETCLVRRETFSQGRAQEGGVAWGPGGSGAFSKFYSLPFGNYGKQK